MFLALEGFRQIGGHYITNNLLKELGFYSKTSTTSRYFLSEPKTSLENSFWNHFYQMNEK